MDRLSQNRATAIRAALLLCGCLLAGCVSARQKQHEALVLETQTFDKQEHELFLAYMSGDVSQAREAMRQSISLYKASPQVVEAGSLSGVLYLEYFHLYVLERRAGNPDAARVALIKARYCLICLLEDEKLPPDKIMEKIESFTPAKIEDIVNNLDRGGSGGELPRYIECIQQSNSSLHQ